MFQNLLQTLFGFDQRFVRLRTEGLPDEVRDALVAFWNDPARHEARGALPLVPADWEALVKGLEEIAAGKVRARDAAAWQNVAREAEALAKRVPVAGALVALQAMAAWVGALGPNLFLQPWTGHHPGWHVFPLIVGRCLVAAEAVWAARLVCETAADFIEAAKSSGFDPVLRRIIGEYRALLARADAMREAGVAALAWELWHHANECDEGFRPELAALFWTAGDGWRGELLGARGVFGYRPPYAIVRDLVSMSLRRIPRDPLLQHIWLEMKDHGPFNLRDHPVPFGLINNYFRDHPLHAQEETMGLPICRPYARAAIGWMRGRVEDADREAIGEAMAMIGPMIRGAAPDAYLRLGALLTHLADETEDERRGHWYGLAGFAADILDWADRTGRYQPYDRVLDLPFAELESGTVDALRAMLDAVEAYRRANNGYWLLIAPPSPSAGDAVGSFLAQEQALLRELRGARFIRLLPHLPAHYRRYGFDLGDLHHPSPKGAKPRALEEGLLPFDPFDQGLAERTLHDTRAALEALFERIRAVAPNYAEARATPPSSQAAFAAALRAHAGPEAVLGASDLKAD